MKISLGIYPNQTPKEIIGSVKLAEEIGFDTVWMLDSHLLFHEVYTLLGAIGAQTSRIKLGTAVTNPLTRHPSVTASAFQTLAELTDGRAVLGISVGDSALKAMGLKVARMAQLAETVSCIRALFKGEVANFGDNNAVEGTRAQLTLSGRSVPIYVAASGPKMLHLTGKIGDGCILMNGIAPDLIRAAIDILREGERDARREGQTKVVVWASCHPDPLAVKYNVARAILRNIPGPVSELTREVAEKVRAAYNYAEHGRSEAQFARLIPDELVDRFAFSGSPEKIYGQIDALRELGVDEVVLAIPVANGITPRDDVLRSLAPRLFH